MSWLCETTKVRNAPRDNKMAQRSQTFSRGDLLPSEVGDKFDRRYKYPAQWRIRIADNALGISNVGKGRAAVQI